MQDHKDPRAFTIVERYAHESSQKASRFKLSYLSMTAFTFSLFIIPAESKISFLTNN